jgi:hypothetical protein
VNAPASIIPQASIIPVESLVVPYLIIAPLAGRPLRAARHDFPTGHVVLTNDLQGRSVGERL